MTKNKAAVALGRLGGLKGGNARMQALSALERSALGSKAARKRWDRKDWSITTQEAAVETVNNYWKNQSAEVCFNAVEELRDATYALYNNGRKTPRLERVYKIVMPTSR